MLESNASNLDVSTLSISKPTNKSQSKVRFENQEINEVEAAYKKANLQQVRIRPDLESLGNNEDDKLILSNSYSKNMIKGKKQRVKTTEIYERQRILKDRHRDMVKQQIFDEDRQEKLK